MAASQLGLKTQSWLIRDQRNWRGIFWQVFSHSQNTKAVIQGIQVGISRWQLNLSECKSCLYGTSLKAWMGPVGQLRLGAFWQVWSYSRKALRGHWWRVSRRCRGDPRMLKIPGFWTGHQGQWKVWSGTWLNLLDKVCVLQRTEIKRVYPRPLKLRRS